MADDNAKSKLYNRPGIINKIAGFVAIVLALSAVIMLCVLFGRTDESQGYLGGFNWIENTFNYHPVMMVAGLVFCCLTAILSYRLVPMSKRFTKAMHVCFHSCAVICLSIGLSAVFIGNDYQNRNQDDKLYANLFSLHSFVGLAALILYGSNYLLGFCHYLMPMPMDYRVRYMPSHVFAGSFALFAAIFAGISGLQELFTEYGCAPQVQSEDLDTTKVYNTMNAGCQLMNSTGLVLLATAFFSALALWENHAVSARQGTLPLRTDLTTKLIPNQSSSSEIRLSHIETNP
jgi:hypothetical protein